MGEHPLPATKPIPLEVRQQRRRDAMMSLKRWLWMGNGWAMLSGVVLCEAVNILFESGNAYLIVFGALCFTVSFVAAAAMSYLNSRVFWDNF